MRKRKLTRKEITETLQNVPIENVLLGASSKSSKLTAKQRAFAEGVALGKTGAQAYRDSYDTQGKAITQGQEAARLKADPKIAAQIKAIALANEARKYATPAALRSLVIERLTAHAIDEDIQPAQRLKALELLGKVTEVAAFTERREIITHSDATTARAALLESLRNALRASGHAGEIVDITPEPSAPEAIEADASAHPGPDSAPPDAHPTTPAPPACAAPEPPPLLSIPHIQSSDFSVGTPPCRSTVGAPENIFVENHGVAAVTPVTPVFVGNFDHENVETPPLGNWVEK